MSALEERRDRERWDPETDPILAVEDLRTTFYTDKETIRAVDGISFDVYPGETVGLVGESGSGKSVTARSIMGLVDSPGRIETSSSIRFQGDELTGRSEEEWRRIRGGGVAMVFQDPLSSLNPVYTVGNQIKESLSLHQGLEGRAATEEAIDLLEAVGIPDAPRRLREYPHEFSGGMRQRAVIAMALACEPEVLIADEPTTALDVTIQAQILELLADLQAERDLAILFITHDMGVIAEVCDRVNVMYAGEIVETAPVEELFQRPAHPYTRGLLASIPGTQPDAERLSTIEGEVPTPTEAATYCRFAPRCPEAFGDCEVVHPQLVPASEERDYHTAACLLYPEDRPLPDAVQYHLDRAEEGEVDETTRAEEDAAVTAEGGGAADQVTGAERDADVDVERGGEPGGGPGAEPGERDRPDWDQGPPPGGTSETETGGGAGGDPGPTSDSDDVGDGEEGDGT